MIDICSFVDRILILINVSTDGSLVIQVSWVLWLWFSFFHSFFSFSFLFFFSFFLYIDLKEVAGLG